MKTRISTVALLSLLWSSSTRPAQAVPVFFFNSPATNSADWSASLAGATINTNVNFNSHPLGALNGSFYTVSDGVTLTGSGFGTGVVNGAGPGDTNNVASPLNSGEGLHPSSNFLQAPEGALSNLTVSFSNPVAGAGFFVIDFFGAAGFGTVAPTLTAFSGANGSGANLGSGSLPLFNFQTNNQVFFGVSDTSNSIGSVVWSYNASSTSDSIGLDDIRFATFAAASGVPEIAPDSWRTPLTFLGAGLLLLAYRRPQQIVIKLSGLVSPPFA